MRRDLSNRFDYTSIACFRSIDKYNSGSIDTYGLGTFLRNLGHFASDRELMNIIRRIDENGDGKIRLDEFMDFLKTSAGFYPQPPSSQSYAQEERKGDRNSPLR